MTCGCQQKKQPNKRTRNWKQQNQASKNMLISETNYKQETKYPTTNTRHHPIAKQCIMKNDNYFRNKERSLGILCSNIHLDGSEF